jgi:putative heme-binding domain-containing protein
MFAHGRSFEVGKQLFKTTNCVACHKMNGEGFEIGQDLTKIDPKNKPEDILRSILEPSQKVDEKFQSWVFELVTGKIITGMVLEETPTTVKVMENPLAKTSPVVIKKSDIDVQQKSPKSIMPEGQLNKLRREEILDLLAYVYSRGDKKHKIFQEHHDH